MGVSEGKRVRMHLSTRLSQDDPSKPKPHPQCQHHSHLYHCHYHYQHLHNHHHHYTLPLHQHHYHHNVYHHFITIIISITMIIPDRMELLETNNQRNFQEMGEDSMFSKWMAPF